MDPAAQAFYEHALATGETPAERVGWRGRLGSQYANFAALCGAVELGDGASVLDVGCGTGELVAFLAATGRRVEYTGVDVSASMVEAARAQHPGSAFEVRDILAAPPARTFDVVVCSGTLNYRVPEHGAWVTRMLQRMYELAGRALAFNLLNAGPPQSLSRQLVADDEFFRVTPEQVLQICRRMSPHIEVHDGRASTFTVVVRRPPPDAFVRLVAELGAGRAEDAALHALAELALRRGLAAELRDFLAAAEPTAYVFDRLAEAHTNLGDHAGAAEALRRSRELAPAAVATVLALARNAHARRDAAGELGAYLQAVAMDPANPAAHYGLVDAQLRGGDRAGARAAALSAPPGALRELLDGATAASLVDATAAFERALALAPRSLDALASLATHYERAGRWREAVALWQRAVALSSDDPRLHGLLQRALRNA